MDYTTLAERSAIVHARLVAVAEKFGEKYALQDKVAALKAVQQQDNAVRTLYQNEALADLWEALAEKLGVVSVQQTNQKEAAPPPPPPPVSEEETEQAASKKAKSK